MKWEGRPPLSQSLKANKEPNDGDTNANASGRDSAQPQRLGIECSLQIRFRHQFNHDEIPRRLRMGLSLLSTDATFTESFCITKRIKGKGHGHLQHIPQLKVDCGKLDCKKPSPYSTVVRSVPVASAARFAALFSTMATA